LSCLRLLIRLFPKGDTVEMFTFFPGNGLWHSHDALAKVHEVICAKQCQGESIPCRTRNPDLQGSWHPA
jgi:hypothetical protein